MPNSYRCATTNEEKHAELTSIETQHTFNKKTNNIITTNHNFTFLEIMLLHNQIS